MRITITGKQGEGKTLAARQLAEVLSELGIPSTVVVLEGSVSVHDYGPCYLSRKGPEDEKPPVIITVEHT